MSKLFDQGSILVTDNSQYTRKIINILLYLCRQGLSLRGHDESAHSHNKENSLELCSLFAIHDNVFASNLQKYFKLTGHVLQNQLIQIAVNHVTRRIAEDIANVGFFCILADEARSFKSEQLALCVRYTNDKLEVKERFVGFVDCSSNSDADGIATAVLEGIEATGLSCFPIVAQSYDGASIMSSRENGVQRKIRQLHPSAVFIHFMAHRMNLVIVDSCKVTRHAQSFFGILEALYCFFARPNNHETFTSTQRSLGIKPMELT